MFSIASTNKSASDPSQPGSSRLRYHAGYPETTTEENCKRLEAIASPEILSIMDEWKALLAKSRSGDTHGDEFGRQRFGNYRYNRYVGLSLAHGDHEPKTLDPARDRAVRCHFSEEGQQKYDHLTSRETTMPFPGNDARREEVEGQLDTLLREESARLGGTDTMTEVDFDEYESFRHRTAGRGWARAKLTAPMTKEEQLATLEAMPENDYGEYFKATRASQRALDMRDLGNYRHREERAILLMEEGFKNQTRSSRPPAFDLPPGL